MNILGIFRSLPKHTLRLSILSLLCVIGLSYVGGQLTINTIKNHAARAEAERISTHIRLIFLEIDSESFWKDPSSTKSKTIYKQIGKNPMLLKVEQLHSLKIWDNTGNLIWVDDPHRVITSTTNKKSGVLQPCAGRNPCAGSNPCAGRNPCAKSNPCAGRQPCANNSKSPGRVETRGGTNEGQGKWLRLTNDNTYQLGVCAICQEREGKEFPVVKTRVLIWQGGIKKAGPPNLTVEIQTEPDFLFVKLGSD